MDNEGMNVQTKSNLVRKRKAFRQIVGNVEREHSTWMVNLFGHGYPGSNDLNVGDRTVMDLLAFQLKPPLARMMALVRNESLLPVVTSK